MKPKKPTRLTKCVTCKEKLGDKKCISCQLCVQWACLPCSGVSEALHDFCQDNVEEMSFLCKDCKLEIPSLRDMKNIKLKQKELEETLTAIQIDITHNKDTLSDQTQTLTDIAETQELHGEEINKHETDLSGIITRLNAIEALVNQAPGENNPPTTAWPTLTANTPPKQQIKTMVRSEISEQAEIEKIKKNLVISGMAETGNEEDDRTAVTELIQRELDITADIEKTERMGRPRLQKEGEALPAPRLMKLCFITQRSRKEVLAKVTNLRRSTNDHVKTLVYIRPDLTKAQLEESKNLRALLKTTREANPTKVFKIQKQQVIEVITPVEPQAPTVQDQPPQPETPAQTD